MKFSVLLPTRNGAPYLRDTVASVLMQPYQDMEIVVSDNASGDETKRIISAFDRDKRVKVVRQNVAISVTENWTRALAASQGDYLLMIGDDDCLMPGFFSVLEAILNKYDSPDCVTYNGFSFVFPGSVGGNTNAYFAPRHFQFGADFRSTTVLSRDLRHSIVRDMFAFKVRFPLNMQLTLFSRRVAERVRGGVFRAPFPDHYALMSLLLLADTFVYVPDRLVVVGVSPKSFGHYYYNGKTTEGALYLGLNAVEDGRLPGSELLNRMREWLGIVKETYPEALESTQISRWNYVGRQVHHWSREFEFGKLSLAEFSRRVSLLTWWDVLSFAIPLTAYRGLLRIMRILGLRRTNMFTEMWPTVRPLPHVRSIAEFVAWLEQAQGI